MAVQVRFNSRALETLRIQAGEDALRPLANKVQNAARRNAPVDTGRLRASITTEFGKEGGRAYARIGSNVSYALFQEEGTGVHGPMGRPITPKGSSVLRWPVKNNSGSGRRRFRNGKTDRYAYAKSVRGAPAVHYLRDALDQLR